MKINRGERKRVIIVFFSFMAWVILILGVLVKLQVFNYGKYTQKIRNQSNRIFSLHPKRGTIYDKHGDILAISVLSKSAFISNKDKGESTKLYGKIVKKISLSYKDRLDIRKRISAGKHFIWIKRKLSEKEFLRIEKVNEEGFSSKVGFVDEYKRIYPQKKVASHILGGVGIDEQGLSGIEFSLDSVIKGKGGKVDAQLDARSQIFSLEYLESEIPGKNLHLTIDLPIQYFVEKKLEEVVKKYNAKGGSVIVMNSKDGSLLAMASYPGYNPSNISHTKQSVLRNNALSFLYYPGSTFKVILASSALENKVCDVDYKFNCYNGEYSMNDLKIQDVHPYATLSFRDIIVYSSNIGAAQIGMRLGDKRYYNYIKKFGFGNELHIRLPAAEKGIVNPLKRWNRYSSAYIAHGYEIYVSPVQMIRALNVIASGGYLVEPKILKSIDGVLFRNSGTKRIISGNTSSLVTDIMVDVVDIGTGKKAALADLKVAGKTGTAKKYKLGKFRKLYVSSFGGFFPVDDPEITIFIVIDEPKGLFYGGDVAAPLFKEISKRVIMSQNIGYEDQKLPGVRI
ncbi:MAG: penicillin-binding protein 2 [Candidatus Aminicenantes bacterium]|nr:penicillin-binding protein 2 [Candidatus Aminicenantes bacterium]